MSVLGVPTLRLPDLNDGPLGARRAHHTRPHPRRNDGDIHSPESVALRVYRARARQRRQRTTRVAGATIRPRGAIPPSSKWSPRKRSSSRWCPAGLRTNPRACAARAARRDSEGARYHPAARSLAGAASAPTPGSAPPRLIPPASPTAGPRAAVTTMTRDPRAPPRARDAPSSTPSTPPPLRSFSFSSSYSHSSSRTLSPSSRRPTSSTSPSGGPCSLSSSFSPPSSSSTARAAISISSPSSSGWISSARSPSSRTFPGSRGVASGWCRDRHDPASVEGGENRRPGHERLGEGGAGG